MTIWTLGRVLVIQADDNDPCIVCFLFMLLLLFTYDLK